MKKILYINDFKEGGGAEQVLALTIALLRDYYEVRSFYGADKIISAETVLGYIYSGVYKKKLQIVLQDYKPDIIHLKNYYHILSPSILAAIYLYKKHSLTPVKVIMTAHDYHLLAPNSGYTCFSWLGNSLCRLEKLPTGWIACFRKWDRRGLGYSVAKLLQWLFAYKIKKLDRVIDILVAPSAFLAQILTGKFPKKQVVVVRNPLPGLRPVCTEPPAVVTRRSPGPLLLVFCGRLSAEKGLLPLLEALADISFDYRLTIIGDGDERSQLEAAVVKFSLQKKVFLLGRLEHSAAMAQMKKNEVLLLPSLWYENAPLSLVEGALQGLKLLTMNYGGMKELAELCGNYFLLDDLLENLEAGLNYLQTQKFVVNESLHEVFAEKKYKQALVPLYEG